MDKPMLVMIPKDARVTEDADWIYVSTTRTPKPRMYAKGSIVLTYPDENRWDGQSPDAVWIDELKDTP